MAGSRFQDAYDLRSRFCVNNLACQLLPLSKLAVNRNAARTASDLDASVTLGAFDNGHTQVLTLGCRRPRRKRTYRLTPSPLTSTTPTSTAGRWHSSRPANRSSADATRYGAGMKRKIVDEPTPVNQRLRSPQAAA